MNTKKATLTKRTEILSTPRQRERWEKAAKRAKVDLASWIRPRLDNAASKEWNSGT